MKRTLKITLAIVLFLGIALFLLIIFRLPIIKAANYALIRTCSWRGGETIPAYCYFGGCKYTCSIPYPDAGKQCTNSKQCSHYCVTDSPQEKSGCKVQNGSLMTIFDCSLATNLVGSCQKHKLQECQTLWELNDKTVTLQGNMACTIN